MMWIEIALQVVMVTAWLAFGFFMGALFCAWLSSFHTGAGMYRVWRYSILYDKSDHEPLPGKFTWVHVVNVPEDTGDGAET